MLRYEGVRFLDGSVAVRRLADDPCDRATLTFESVRELEEDVGSAEVTWIVDRGSSKPPAVPPPGLSCIRRHDEFAVPMRPAYEGDGHPAIRAALERIEAAVTNGHQKACAALAKSARYEPTEETDEA